MKVLVPSAPVTALAAVAGVSLSALPSAALPAPVTEVDFAISRGQYGEVPLTTLPKELADTVRDMVNEAANASKVDGHGTWEFGAEFDRKGRGSALNWDVYAVGNDVHDGGFLTIVQVRQFIRARKYPELKKSYFLIGRNEDGKTFAHCVESRVITHAIRVGDDVIRRVQDWIFGGDYRGMLRQGDLALIPMAKAVGDKTGRRVMVLEDSHKLSAGTIRKTDSAVYAKNPVLLHLEGTHPKVEAAGWYKIVVGRRASHYSFAAPTID